MRPFVGFRDDGKRVWTLAREVSAAPRVRITNVGYVAEGEYLIGAKGNFRILYGAYGTTMEVSQ